MHKPEYTIAGRIQAQYGYDGTCHVDKNGASLHDTCAHLARYASFPNGSNKRFAKYTFFDDSVITVRESEWDIGYLKCWCWQRDGHGKDCEELNTLDDLPSTDDLIRAAGVLKKWYRDTPDAESTHASRESASRVSAWLTAIANT